MAKLVRRDGLLLIMMIGGTALTDIKCINYAGNIHRDP